jgi:hypothetical protein
MTLGFVMKAGNFADDPKNRSLKKRKNLSIPPAYLIK